MTRVAAIAVLLVQSAAAYRIAGKVVNSVSGAPLNRVRVYLTLTNEARTPLPAVITGPDGAFRFDELAAGKYGLMAERLGFARQSYNQRSLFQSYSTAIAVGEEEPTEDLVFRLIPGAIITGYVKDSRGEPLPHIRVSAGRVVGMGSRRHTQTYSMASTDDRGYYRISALASGTYVLVFTAATWQYMQAPEAEEMSYPVTFFPGVTDSASAGMVRVQAGGETRADVVMRSVRSCTLRGRLAQVDPKQRLVAALRFSAAYDSSLYLGESVAVNGDRFTFDNVPAGRYSLGIWDGSNTLVAIRTIDVAAPETEVTIGDVPLARVSATVQARGEPRRPQNPLVLSLMRVDRTWGSALPVDRNGRVEFTAAPPGSYEIVVHQGWQLAIQSLEVKGAKQASGQIDIPETGTVELSLLVDAAAGELKGRVFRGDRPEGGILALLVPKSAWQNVAAYRIDQSDSDGTFGWPGVAPGEYLAWALDDGEAADYMNAEVVRGLLPKAQALTVTDPATQRIRIQAQAQ